MAGKRYTSGFLKERWVNRMVEKIATRRAFSQDIARPRYRAIAFFSK
jgi:hypothetical protein